MTVVEHLEAAYGLIADEKRWTKEVYARNASGEPVMPEDQSAVCWCSVGALRAINIDFYPAQRFLLKSIYDGVTPFNDSHTHSEVMEMWSRAITLAKLEQNS